MKKNNKRRPLLGEILLKMEVITEQELEEALELQKKNRQLLGQILISLGYCSAEVVIAALDMQGISIFDNPREI